MAKKSKKKRKNTGGGGGSDAGEDTAGQDGAGPRIPGWLPAVLFLTLTLILFRAFVFSDQMLLGNDTLGLGYVARAFYADALKELGMFPGWAPLILGGTPFLEALSGGDSLYPPSVILLLLTETYRALGWKLVIHILAAGFFMFGWIRRGLGASRAAALLAGTAYTVAPFLVSLVHPGHDGKIFVTALAPLLFWAVERHFARGGLAAFAGTGLMVALVIFTTHFQMAYFLFGAVGLFAIFRAVQVARGTGVVEDGEATEGDGAGGGAGPDVRVGATRFATFLAASVLGAAGAGVQLFPAADYVTEYSRRIQTTRAEAGETGRAWSSSWSMHPEEAMSMVIPEFAGNNAQGPAWTSGTYWGRNAFKDNHEYAGLVILLLAAVSFAGAARKGLRWFFTGLGGVAFLFALGTHTPVWGLFYALVPGIRLFRAPSQTMFLFGFAAITLAALGLDRILQAARQDEDEAWQPILRTLWIATGGLAFLALMAASGTLTSLWTSVVYSDVGPGKLGALQTLQPFIGRGAWVATLLAGGTAAAAWALKSRYLAPSGLVAIVVLLAAADGLRVSTAFVQTLDFQRWAQAGPNIQTVLDREASDPEPYRLLSFSQRGQDVKPALHGIELAAGHHPNDLSRYRELIGMVGSGLPENLANANIRRLLNVEYILWPDFQLGPAPQGTVLSRSQLSDGRVYETLLAENGLPRARLVGSAVVKSDDEAVPYMLSDDFDPAAEVVLSEEPPLALPGGPVQGTVTWEERTPDRLRLSVRAEEPALLVLAENWFPAWKVTVDGAEQPLLRAYHTLRAVPVPAGEHTVEMVYESSVVGRSLWVSVAVLLALAGLGGFDLWRRRQAAAGGSVRPREAGEEAS